MASTRLACLELLCFPASSPSYDCAFVCLTNSLLPSESRAPASCSGDQGGARVYLPSVWARGAQPLPLRLCLPVLAPASAVGLPSRSAGELPEVAALREMDASAGACKG